MINKLREEKGVALATVIFVAAALTVVSATSAAIAIKEFRSGTEDRKAAEALNYAESGIDRMMEYLRGGDVNFGLVRQAGCNGNPAIILPQGKVGNGTYDVSLRADCVSAATATTARSDLLAIIRSEGTHPNARRVIEQVIKVEAMGLPVGIAADTISGNGSPNQPRISMLSKGKLIGRGQLNFTGLDPWYRIKDFWPNYTGTDAPVPASAHAVGGILLKSNNTDPEFTTAAPKNCTANKDVGNRQSLWDGDGSSTNPALDPRKITSDCANNAAGAYPPSSYFGPADYERIAPKKLTAQDRLRLKQAAKTYGQYCFIPTSGSGYCIRRGVQIAFTTAVGNLPTVAKNFVAYYEFQSGDPLQNAISFNSEVWGCDQANPNNTRSMVLVVERGGLDYASGARVNGAFLLDGAFKFTGSSTINGTVVASEFWFRGDSSFSLDDCWVQQMPGPWLAIDPVHWREVDR